MKKISVLAILSAMVLTSSAFAAPKNPFIGEWSVEIIDVKDEITFTFDDTTVTLKSNEEQEQKGNYSIDLAKKQIVIDDLKQMVTVFTWKVKDANTIDLYAYSGAESKVKEAMLAPIRQKGETESQINSVTKDAYEQMIRKMTEMLDEIPLIRLKKKQ
ncbi:MAG TPA: hypothetical protein PKK43_07845 [Spirochaetota bacterium]|nr:hypothetical protein [Spirochaetota bacterium]